MFQGFPCELRRWLPIPIRLPLWVVRLPLCTGINRMNEQQKEPGDDRNGAVHADLSGASAHFRFRTERLKVASFEFASTCNFNLGGVFHTSLGVIDVSTTGLGIQTESSITREQKNILP